MAGESIARISKAARGAARARKWQSVAASARQILRQDRNSAEGWFLTGLAENGTGRARPAAEAFGRALRLDADRYDAAAELARLYRDMQRHREARDLLDKYEPQFAPSPVYLHHAAETWSRLGLHARAWPLYCRADELQPGVPRFEAGRAACAVLLGKAEEARSIYLRLLERQPTHQRNHFELSRLGKATDRKHVDQMQRLLAENGLPDDKNIFLCYAIAKELEDLGDWDESFDYYRRGGDAAAAQARAAGYSVAQDVALIDRIIDVCDARWLAQGTSAQAGGEPGNRPLFVTGLPRTGTTLTERILASHSQVESADETFFLPLAVKKASGVHSRDEMNPRIVEGAARANPARIARDYLAATGYRLQGKPLFIDKYPFNFLYTGFIARAFPDLPVVQVVRHPMDSCFAMYKQSFFRFAYTLEDLAEYYVAWDRLRRHWGELLGERLVAVTYEALVSDPEAQIRRLLERLGLPFEQACVDFHLNAAPSATASTLQVREKAHTRSIGRWKHFERPLRPLRERLEAAGIGIS